LRLYPDHGSSMRLRKRSNHLLDHTVLQPESLQYKADFSSCCNANCWPLVTPV